MARSVIITGHTANDYMKELMLNCINSFKHYNFKVIVSDHIYHKEIFDATDIYVINESNPILTPKDYEKYNLNHVSHRIEHSIGYNTYTPYETFAAFSILELVKKGFEQVEEDKALIVNYDFILKKSIDELFEKNEEGVFFRYPYPNSFYSSVYILNKRLLSKLNDIKSIDDYAKNLKYLEWWMYDLYKDENVLIFDKDYKEYFDGDLYYRSGHLRYDPNFWELPDGKVLMKFGNQSFVYDKTNHYEYFQDKKKLVFNLDDLHFKWHKAFKI